MSNDTQDAGTQQTLVYDGAETHKDAIEGEHIRHYYDCPDCDWPLAEWMDCPECGWYDEDVWSRTLSEGSR